MLVTNVVPVEGTIAASGRAVGVNPLFLDTAPLTHRNRGLTSPAHTTIAFQTRGIDGAIRDVGACPVNVATG
jgi:hypothetical protein